MLGLRLMRSRGPQLLGKFDFGIMIERQADSARFDMGGTSTDVSRFDGKLEHTFENVIAGVTVMAPQLDINTVAAGGGSILDWKNGYVNDASIFMAISLDANIR